MLKKKRARHKISGRIPQYKCGGFLDMKILTVSDDGCSLKLVKDGGDFNESFVGLFFLKVLVVSFNHC
jgi:hypothetical protein